MRRRSARCGPSGDWIVPTFNGEPRYHKPILIYWLMGLGTAVAGDNRRSAPGSSRRWPAPGPACWSGSWAGGCSGRGRACWPGLMLAVSPIVVAESKLATTDATLTFWLVGCQCCLWELARRPSRVLAGIFWALPRPRLPDQGAGRPGLLLAAAALAWWWGWPVRLVWKRLHPR